MNWNAERQGCPRRSDRHPDAVVIEPRWAEYVLCSDADIGGAWLELGPFVIQSVMNGAPSRMGIVRRPLLLRYWDHLCDAPSGSVPLKTDVEDYVGGDIGDEMAALLGLALSRRIRSGGMTRRDVGDSHPLGIAFEDDSPYLEPPRRDPMIWWIAQPADLSDARGLLARYPTLAREDAVALVRAARQYVEGLWYADLDPRIAWVKLIGALETAAAREDDSRRETNRERLKRHNPALHALLDGLDPLLADGIAGQVAGLFKAQQKVMDFVEKYKADEPPVRPDAQALQVDWSSVDETFKTIYGHRSRELHQGLAFPWPLSRPPFPDAGTPVPPERFAAIAMATHGAQWSADDLPMYLHVFAHLVGGTLRNWWASKGDPEPS